MRRTRVPGVLALAASGLLQSRTVHADSQSSRQVTVIGAGVIGVTTAYSLAKKGYTVTVLDRNSNVSEEASRVNACSLRTSSWSPICQTSTIRKLVTGLISSDPSFVVNWSNVLFDSTFWDFMLQFILATSSTQRFAQSEAFLRDFAPFTVSRTLQIAQEENLQFNLRTDCGALVVYVDGSEGLAAAECSRAAKEAAGVSMCVLSKDQVLQQEPCLIDSTLKPNLSGGIRYANDCFGDCRKFCENLAQVCTEKYGVRFVMDCNVQSLEQEEGKVVAYKTADGTRQIVEGNVVLCAGCESTSIARSVDVHVPLYPMKGYSITIRLSNVSGISPKQVPSGLLILEPFHTYVIRMDQDHVRFASVAEFDGWDTSRPNPICVDALRLRCASWFPQYQEAIYSPEALVLTGGRPQSPDDMPIISTTTLSNLFLNTGHGQYGWRTACGSAAVLECVLSGTPLPEGAPENLKSILSVKRFEIFKPK